MSQCLVTGTFSLQPTSTSSIRLYVIVLSQRGNLASVLHSRCLKRPLVYFREPPNFPEYEEVLKACCCSYLNPAQLISISFVKEATEFRSKLRNCVKFKQCLDGNNCRPLTYTAYVIGLRNPEQKHLLLT
jgi:hypothetical protein